MWDSVGVAPRLSQCRYGSLAAHITFDMLVGYQLEDGLKKGRESRIPLMDNKGFMKESNIE